MNTELLAAIGTLVNHDQITNLPNVVENVALIQKWSADRKLHINPEQCHEVLAELITFGKQSCGHLKEAADADMITITIGSSHYQAKRGELPGLPKVAKGSHYIFCEKGEHPELQKIINTFKTVVEIYRTRRGYVRNTRSKMESMVELPKKEFLGLFPELEPFKEKSSTNWLSKLLGSK